MNRLFSSTGILAAVGLVALLTLPAHAQTNVNFSNLGTFTQSSPLSAGGVIITSTGTFSLNGKPAYGLGILGGGAGVDTLGKDNIIDNGESALFTFVNGPATNVSVYLSAAQAAPGGTATTIEALGSGGASLGVFTAYGSGNQGLIANPDLSSRVGGAAISAFRITGGDHSGVSVGAIRYTTAAVSEPGEYAVMGLAGLTVGGLILRARRRKVSTGVAV